MVQKDKKVNQVFEVNQVSMALVVHPDRQDPVVTPVPPVNLANLAIQVVKDLLDRPVTKVYAVHPDPKVQLDVQALGQQ